MFADFSPPAPAVAICGWSGSGKTTLIQELLPILRSQGLQVAVLKRTHHHLAPEGPGRDSERLFRSGADVWFRDSAESIYRRHGDTIPLAEGTYDLILVEGQKNSRLPKIWLFRKEDEQAPKVENLLECLPPGPQRAARAAELIQRRLRIEWLSVPVWGCVLVGGTSSRMGFPKHLIRTAGVSWAERAVRLLEKRLERVVVAGAGRLPEALQGTSRLPDVPDAEGPLAGVLAALRWNPGVGWLVLACDLPQASPEAVDWLLAQRRPGAWAVFPRLSESGVEPLFGFYDSRARCLLEASASRGDFSLSGCAGHEKVATPEPPSDLVPAWRNVNDPSSLPPESCGPEV